MDNLRTITIDAGYGYIKVFDGQNQVIIPSVISQSRQIRFKPKTRNMELINNLNVKINGDGYFVGQLAINQGKDPMQVLDKNKVFHSTTKVSMLVGIAMLANNGETIKVVTGLPISYYENSQKNELEKILKGKQNVEFDGFLLDKENEAKEFTVSSVVMLPQPIGSLFNMILDDAGDIKDEMVNLANGTVAVIDIGYGTTDFLVMKELDYVDRSSRSISIGIKDIYDDVREALQEMSKEEVPLYKIEETRDSKKISLKGVEYDLFNAYNHACRVVFSKIKTIIDPLSDREQTISNYVITGGGVHLLGDLFKTIYTNVNIIVLDNAQMANVLGYAKYAKNK